MRSGGIRCCSSRRFDRLVKCGRYQRAGIEYWIVDLDARLLERWMPGEDRPSIHTQQLTWQPTGAATPLVLDLERLFDEVLGPATSHP